MGLLCLFFEDMNKPKFCQQRGVKILIHVIIICECVK